MAEEVKAWCRRTTCARLQALEVPGKRFGSAAAYVASNALEKASF